MPWWMWIWFRRLVGRKLTQTFQGAEGQATVGVDQEDVMDARDKLLLNQLNLLVQAEDYAKKALVSPFLKQITKSSVNLWKDIRKLVFGMLDGSDLRRFELVAQDDKVPIFSRVSQVIQSPSDKFELSEDTQKELDMDSINWTNLEISDSVLVAYADKSSKLKTDLDGKLTRTVEIDAQIAGYQALLQPVGAEVTGATNG